MQFQQHIPLEETGYFSRLILDYISNNEKIEPFYNRFPNLENFKAQIVEKQENYAPESRKILMQTLQEQYTNIPISKTTKTNIDALKNKTTFTVTTGHQLNLFTGPLYFLYKIITTINLAKQLNAHYGNYHFVPVYWMATEDHDFDEINFFRYKNEKIQWNSKAKGAVGTFSTAELDTVFSSFSKLLGKGINANYLRELFKKSYLEHPTLATATHYLVNQLFGKTGLVILDANNKALKQLFSAYMQNEITNQSAYKAITTTNFALQKASKKYTLQVQPRKLNLFYLQPNLRERIVKEKDTYNVLNSSVNWKRKEVLEAIENYPERFSPNVVMRPLYQEVVLPNLAYIGGGGELAYWLQLKEYFANELVTFPILVLRNSLLLKTQKQQKLQEKLQVSNLDLFLKTNQLLTKKAKAYSKLKIDFIPQKKQLQKQFIALYKLANQTDKSFIGAVAAQEKKQIKGLENLEKRLLKAEKKRLKEKLQKVETLQNELFPNATLQERYANFSQFYESYGASFIALLVQKINPLQTQFLVLTI